MRSDPGDNVLGESLCRAYMLGLHKELMGRYDLYCGADDFCCLQYIESKSFFLRIFFISLFCIFNLNTYSAVSTALLFWLLQGGLRVIRPRLGPNP